MTGADLYIRLCTDAWMEAIKRRIRQQDGAEEAEEDRPSSRGVGRERRTAVASAGGFYDSSLVDDEDLYGRASADPTAAAGGDRDDALPLSSGAPAASDRAPGASAEAAAAPSAGGEGGVVVSHRDFLAALRGLVPSLSREELQKYERLRDHYQGTRA